MKLAIALLLAAAAAVCSAQPSENRDFPTYYLQPWPEKVAAYLELVDRQDAADTRKSFGLVVGFMAELLRRHPEKTQEWLTARAFSRKTQIALVHALWMAGRRDDAKAAASAYRWSPQQIATLESAMQRMPDMSALSPSTGNELDMFWGAFSASGSARHVERILDAYHSRARDSRLDPKDVLAVAGTMGKRDREPAAVEELKKIRARYPDNQTARALVLAATALWALGANARQDELVSDIVLNYLASAHDIPATRVLAAHTANASIAVAGNARDRAMLTTISDPSMFEAIGAGQLARGELFKHHRKTFGRSDPGYVALLIFTGAGQSMEYSVQVKGPGNTLISHPPRTVRGPTESGQASIHRALLPLKARNDALPGIYRITAKFRPGDQAPFELKTLTYVEHDG